MDNAGLRALLAVALSMLILFASQYFYSKYFQPTQTEKSSTINKTISQAETTKKAEVERPLKSSEPKVLKSDETHREVVIENEVFKVTLSNEGATIKTVELKKYKDSRGNPVRFVSSEISALSILKDSNYIKSLFSVDDTKISFKNNDEAVVTFSYSDSEISVKRTYKFNKTDYAITVIDEVEGVNSYYVTLGKDFGVFDKEDAPHWGPVVLKEADRIEINPSKIKDSIIYKDVNWVAQEDKYFFSALVPSVKSNQFSVVPYKDTAVIFAELPQGKNIYRVFIAPKEYDYLKKFDVGLEHIVDFGFFSIVARPLFWFLKFLYSIFGNYGIAIIILTVLVRIPFIPIVNRGQKSMQKLSELQPKLMQLKEQYKNDPQRLQKEMMELYRKYKINPFTGCLPILLQIPIFFALYKVLTIAIELRQAPFALWIQDLSVKDPYYVLPILMGVTMFIQQKITPSTADPTQQRIMLLLPVVFTFLFLSFPSGLVLYWLINNVFGIAQQLYINQKIKKAK